MLVLSIVLHQAFQLVISLYIWAPGGARGCQASPCQGAPGWPKVSRPWRILVTDDWCAPIGMGHLQLLQKGVYSHFSRRWRPEYLNWKTIGPWRINLRPTKNVRSVQSCQWHMDPVRIQSVPGKCTRRSGSKNQTGQAGIGLDSCATERHFTHAVSICHHLYLGLPTWTK
jgi:hypothetical protein